MANVLEKIVADKRVELELLKQKLPLDSFVHDLTPSNKSLFDALNQENAGFIFECKKASPSKGLIREHFDLDEIIDGYREDAAAFSVLTDFKYFQGKFEYLAHVTGKVTQPVLNKDFFVDEYQVHLARKYNADAILLMLSVLNDNQYMRLSALAQHYKLDVLTEVSNEQEAERAVNLKANIIGINNRNLRDLSTDLATTERLVPMITEQADYPFVLISESGIYTHQDVLRLAPLVNGFLVGSSLMAQKDLKLAVKQLVYGNVKVCGMTRAEDIRYAKAKGAKYAGLIFAERSPRYISPTAAKQLTEEVPFQYVGVFVNENIDLVVELATELKLAAVQLHGDEDQSYINQLKVLLPAPCQIWKAKGVTDELPELGEDDVDCFLLDCKVGDQSGGTGQKFNWQLLQQMARVDNLILAGGINPENIAEAASTLMSMLDLNSGVESSPGIKSHKKLDLAFDQLRRY